MKPVTSNFSINRKIAKRRTKIWSTINEYFKTKIVHEYYASVLNDCIESGENPEEMNFIIEKALRKQRDHLLKKIQKLLSEACDYPFSKINIHCILKKITEDPDGVTTLEEYLKGVMLRDVDDTTNTIKDASRGIREEIDKFKAGFETNSPLAAYVDRIKENDLI
jgi:hypothetical protein